MGRRFRVLGVAEIVDRRRIFRQRLEIAGMVFAFVAPLNLSSRSGFRMAALREDYFFQVDPNNPAEYLVSRQRIGFVEGELALMLAVLEEAVDCYKRNLFASDRKGKSLFEETEAWFSAHDSDAVFSFEYVCEALGFDADYLRAGLEQWKGKQASSHNRKKKGRRK